MHHPCWFNPFIPNISFSNSSLCLPYNSHDIGSENLVLHQLLIPLLIFYWYFSLLSSLVCLILYWMIYNNYCKEKFFLGHSWELKGSITQILSFWRGLSMHGKVKNKGTYSKKIISIKSLKKLANFSKIWMDYKCTGVSLVTLLKFKWSRAKCEKMK